PGRLELIRAAGRDVLLDGAHNPAGATALATALDDLRPFLDPGPVTLVTATTLPGSRAMPAEALAERWRRLGPTAGVRAEGDPETALTRALDADGPVVVAGSLYLVGVARARLVDDPDLRDPDPA